MPTKVSTEVGLQKDLPSPVDDVWNRKGPDRLAHIVQQHLAHRIVMVAHVRHGDVGVNCLALDWVIHTVWKGQSGEG